MVDYLTHDLILHLILFQIVILMIILSNVLLLHSARRHVPLATLPVVSILVPARNEEKNIARCIQSLLSQDSPSFEVLVVDDRSEDNTLVTLERIAGLQPKLKILAGSSPPEGQVGKNWACVQ